jgi:hypothetical protein
MTEGVGGRGQASIILQITKTLAKKAASMEVASETLDGLTETSAVGEGKQNGVDDIV